MFDNLDVYYGHHYVFNRKGTSFTSSGLPFNSKYLDIVNREVLVSFKLKNTLLSSNQRYSEVIRIGDEIHLAIGHSKCHPDDNFNRKLGRQIAKDRMEDNIFEVTKIVLTKELTYVTIENKKYRLEYSIYPNKEYFRLESAET